MHKLTFVPNAANPTSAPGRSGQLLPRLGHAMQSRRQLILLTQWCVVVFYFALLVIPAFMPLPPQDAHLYNNLRLFAQFLFWGIWWPFVMLSTMLLGRVWCGVFCPEGMLTELASRHGLGLPIPRWIRWSGWPFLAFVSTTVYGQLVSVYEYPQAALLVLGGSTVLALVVGFVYGKGKRVWCRYLCPANGVFALLAKISPLHFAVDEAAWQRYPGRPPMVDCAPLIDIRHMKSTSACHACGRCSGYRDAVQLRLRAPDREILAAGNKDAGTEQALTLIFGLIGVASAAFLWSSSAWFVQLKTAAAEWLIERDAFLLLQDNAPWWLLTHYPQANDVFSWLDGACILGFILGGGGALGLAVLAALRLALWINGQPQLKWQRLALTLVPMGGCGVFLGLSMLTVSHINAERIAPAMLAALLPGLRLAVLGLGGGFSAWLGWRMLGIDWRQPKLRSLLAYAALLLAPALIIRLWTAVFFA